MPTPVHPWSSYPISTAFTHLPQGSRLARPKTLVGYLRWAESGFAPKGMMVDARQSVEDRLLDTIMLRGRLLIGEAWILCVIGW